MKTNSMQTRDEMRAMLKGGSSSSSSSKRRNDDDDDDDDSWDGVDVDSVKSLRDQEESKNFFSRNPMVGVVISLIVCSLVVAYMMFGNQLTMLLNPSAGHREVVSVVTVNESEAISPQAASANMPTTAGRRAPPQGAVMRDPRIGTTMGDSSYGGGYEAPGTSENSGGLAATSSGLSAGSDEFGEGTGHSLDATQDDELGDEEKRLTFGEEADGYEKSLEELDNRLDRYFADDGLEQIANE